MHVRRDNNCRDGCPELHDVFGKGNCFPWGRSARGQRRRRLHLEESGVDGGSLTQAWL